VTIAQARSGEPTGSAEQTWKTVDDYFSRALIAADSAPAQVERASEAAPLPDPGCGARTQPAIPLTDAHHVTTVLAWPPHSRCQAVAGLVRTAAQL
jgi:hypothetical protein